MIKIQVITTFSFSPSSMDLLKSEGKSLDDIIESLRDGCIQAEEEYKEEMPEGCDCHSIIQTL